MHHRLVVVISLAALAPACIANTARGIAANGAPLRVRTDSSSGTYQAQQVVGQDTYYDRDGNAAGSVERTRMVTKRWSKTDVSFYQGADQVDEQDYYHLAKDANGVDEIKEARAQMSRDLTIGFPVAIAGALGSTLLATGTFGESKALRVYAATGATVVALVGAYFAFRGLQAYRKKPVLGVGRAIQHASEVEHCYRGRCTKVTGGSPQVTEAPPPAAPTSLGMRKTAPRWSGTWSGAGRAVTRTKDGRAMTKSSQMEFQIEEGAAGSLVVTLEPRDASSCKLTARVRGDRAELDAGQTCRRRQPDGEIAMTVREGALALADDQVTLAMGVDLELTAKGRTKGPRTARLVSDMSVTATRN